MKNIKSTLLFIFSVILLFSCQQDELHIEEQGNLETSRTNSLIVEEDLPIGDEMVLGKKLKNPYAIENINKAIELINSKKKVIIGNAVSTLATMDATHYYIKFKPTSADHCETLLEIENSEEIMFFAYPLDSEIIQEGTTPLADGISDAGINELYAVIPIGDPIPNVPYEILDRIIPELEQDLELVEAVSFVLTDNGDEIEPGLTIDDVFVRQSKIEQLKRTNLGQPGLEIDSPKTNLFLPRWRPQGNLLVHDTELNRGVAVKHTQVSIGRWFKWTRVYTNNNGTFVSDKNFNSTKVRVRTRWRGTVGTIRKSWNEILGIRVSDHAFTIFNSSNGRTSVIGTNNRHLWFKATVNNALVKVNDFWVEKGMSGKISNANIWVAESNEGGGAALLLREFKVPILAKGIAATLIQEKWWGWLGIQAILPTVGLSHLYPDLIFRFDDAPDTASVDSLVFHEGAHYMHAKQAGGSFWADVVAAEFNNIISLPESDPYGNGSQPNFRDGELIALAEGWADFIRYRMLLELYDDRSFNIEGYRMFDTPLQEPMLSRVDEDYGWWLTGLFWDLYDTNDDFVTWNSCCTDGTILRRTLEDVEGDYQPIFGLMNSSVVGPRDLENAIINTYPQITARTQTLFTAYGF